MLKKEKNRDWRWHTDEHITTDHWRSNYQDSTVLGLYLFCPLQMLSVWASLKFCHLVESMHLQKVSTHVNPFPNKPWFSRVCCTSLLKMLSVWASLKFCHLVESMHLQKVSTHVNPFPNKPWFSRVCCTSLLKTLGKGEIARNEQFLHFPQCFLPVWRTFSHFHQT